MNAELLSFLRPKECLALGAAKRLLYDMVNVTQLLSPRGYTSFVYNLGRKSNDSCSQASGQHIQVVGMQVAGGNPPPPPPPLSSSPTSSSTTTSSPPLGDADLMLRNGRALMHMDTAKCVAMVNSTLRVLLPLLATMPPALLRCQGPAVTDKDWLGGRIIVTVQEQGFQVQVQRPVASGPHEPSTTSSSSSSSSSPTTPSSSSSRRFEDVFRLMLGLEPVHMTYDLIEEVPEICRFNSEIALQVESRVGAYKLVAFDFQSGVINFAEPKVEEAPLPPSCCPVMAPSLRVRFLVAGVYDERQHQFAWGWAVKGLPEHIREEVGQVMRHGAGEEQHHAVFDTSVIHCDERVALILAGFVGHRLRETHAAIYRHRDAKLRRIIYLALENDCDAMMDCE